MHLNAISYAFNSAGIPLILVLLGPLILVQLGPFCINFSFVETFLHLNVIRPLILLLLALKCHFSSTGTFNFSSAGTFNFSSTGTFNFSSTGTINFSSIWTFL